MPIKLLAPIYETFTLDYTDKKYENDGEPTTVTIKQARQHEHQLRQDLFAKVRRTFNTGRDADPNKVTLEQEISLQQVHQLEAWLTLCECTIVDENGKALFPSKKDKDGKPYLNMNRDQFNQAWGMLFPDIADEIIQKIRVVNPLWEGLGE